MPNRAYRITNYGGPEVLRLDDIPVPVPTEAHVLVAVGAAGVNGLDWKVQLGFLRNEQPLVLPAVLGSELAGTVIKVEPGGRFEVGDRVMGPIGFGAYTDFAAVPAAGLCRTPESLSDVEAAAIPVAALTAWQSLEAGGLTSGMTVLIQGAAGGVGGFAVQFAKAAGATVLATASAASRDHLCAIGADTVFDYRAAHFDDGVEGIDLVLDLIGGETLDRSWRLLGTAGTIVSTAAPDIGARAPAGARGLWFSMHSDADELKRIADDVASGKLKSTIAETFGLTDLPIALDRNRTGHAPGKIVIDLTL